MRSTMHILSMVRRGTVAAGAFAAIGCLGKSLTIPDNRLPVDALVAVTGEPPTTIMALGATQQLSATGLSVTGGAITTFDSVIYQFNTLGDSVRVRLSNTGLMTGLASSGVATVLINVIAFRGVMVRGDQVVVQVTPTVVAGPLTFSIHPVAPDSAKLSAGTTKTIVPVLWNATSGVSVAGPAVKYTVKGGDSARVDIYHGLVRYYPVGLSNTGNNIIVKTPRTSNSGITANQIIPLSGEGSAWIYARVNAYGTVLQDSVQYTFTYPYTQTLSATKVNLGVVNLYAGQILTLAPGAVVTFQNGLATTDPLTFAYAFDNSAAATAASPASTTGGASGNVTTLTGGQTSRRQFLTPGAYHWTMTASGGPAPWPGQTQAGTILIK